MIRKERQLVYCLSAIMAFGMLACSGEKKKSHDAAQYQTMVVGKKDMTLERQYTARLQGRQIVEIRPQVSGCITRICINEGDPVFQIKVENCRFLQRLPVFTYLFPDVFKIRMRHYASPFFR